MHEALVSLAPTSAYETFSRARMDGLETDVARLALRVLGARLDRDRDGLLVFFVGVVLFRVAAAVYLLKDLLVAAAPVVVATFSSLRLAGGLAAPRVVRAFTHESRGTRAMLCLPRNPPNSSQ